MYMVLSVRMTNIIQINFENKSGATNNYAETIDANWNCPKWSQKFTDSLSYTMCIIVEENSKGKYSLKKDKGAKRKLKTDLTMKGSPMLLL